MVHEARATQQMLPILRQTAFIGDEPNSLLSSSPFPNNSSPMLIINCRTPLNPRLSISSFCFADISGIVKTDSSVCETVSILVQTVLISYHF